MMNEFLARLAERFDPRQLANWVADRLPDLAVALLVLFVAWLLWRVVRRATGALMERAAIDSTAHSFVTGVARAAIFIVAGVMALGQLGINTGSVLASLGVAGLTIGFAAKDALSNIIAGLFIFWDRPFVLGDLVEIDGQYGRVDQITLRSTRVVTVDGRMLAIPNTTIVNSTVVSYTNFPNLRLDVGATVGVNEDLGRVRQLALDLVKDNEAYLSEPAPRLVVKALNDYNVEVELQAWLQDEKSHVRERFALREQLFEALRTAGVVMPYETLEIVRPQGEAA
ncbi:MAG: mechanosensitive ion channel [Deltaproteobacteria bacterium]|jgi:small conductance mechanosensitive channel